MSSEGTRPAGNQPANPTQQPPPANVPDQQASDSDTPTNDEGQPLQVPNETTPPFTEAVPNPPTGDRAAEIIENNQSAAELRGDDAAAAGYEKAAEEAADLTAQGEGAKES